MHRIVRAEAPSLARTCSAASMIRSRVLARSRARLAPVGTAVPSLRARSKVKARRRPGTVALTTSGSRDPSALWRCGTFPARLGQRTFEGLHGCDQAVLPVLSECRDGQRLELLPQLGEPGLQCPAGGGEGNDH